MDDRWKKRVVDFKGTCGAGWYKECVGRPCFVEILVDEVSATSVGYDRCEYGYGSEFLCISQVSIKHIKEQSSALFFRTEKHALSISVDYTAVGGQMHVIPPIYVSEHDANRVMILLNNRKERVAVLTSANYSTILDVEAMDGIEFERFVGDVFTRLGFNVEFTKATGDQGVDILARKQDEIIAIQAKCYIGRVGNNAILLPVTQFGVAFLTANGMRSRVSICQLSNNSNVNQYGGTCQSLWTVWIMWKTPREGVLVYVAYPRWRAVSWIMRVTSSASTTSAFNFLVA